MTPPGVILPIRLVFERLIVPAVNHMFPSGPWVMLDGTESPAGIVNSVISPVVVILPILAPVDSVNHMLPSGPWAMPKGFELATGRAYSVIVPAWSILPTV